MARQVPSKPSATGKKRYWLQLTGKGMMLWFCLIFLVSGWMFVLGVLVGRGTAPVNFDIQAIQNELIALKKSMLEKEKGRVESVLEKGGAGKTFEFYEILRGKNKQEAIDLPLAEKKQEKSIKAAPVKEKETSASVNGARKAGDKPKKAASTEGNIAVQVASTRDPESADRMVAKLRQKGYSAFSEKADVAEKGTWHRVRVGYFYDKAAAESIRHQLVQEGYEGIIVRK